MKDCVGMLLAGGEGKRLGKLTDSLAKPAVHFGGKYRIIDFTLSNCTNSGIQTVGVLTQYSPLELNKHIGNGRPWDLNQNDGGATVLSPYTAHSGGVWYSGTADAIYQNMHFIDHYDPKQVLIISGDHIYQMDYAKLLEHHRKTEADATISVLPVEWEDAPRFGILNTTDDLRVYEFDEKPDVPKSNLASMGIYIFNWDVLKSYLINDEQDETSSHDFGKDIIPAMLRDDLRLYAYRFEGYWKDVGTVQSYWQANMDMLNEELEHNLNTRNWRIYTNESNLPPQYIDEQATITKSLVDTGCWVSGAVERSLLFKHVDIGAHSHVSQSILHPGVKVGENAVLERVIVMENTDIPPDIVIRSNADEEPYVIDETSLQGILASD